MEGEDKFINVAEQANAENIVVDAELEMSYKETVINLPEHRAQETGITKIRRREILNVPEYIKTSYQNITRYRTSDLEPKVEAFYDKITDGKFPSGLVWNHILNADTHGKEKKLADHIKEGIYFQKIYLGDTYTVTTRTEKTKAGIFNLDTMSGEHIFNSSINTPTYFFGNKNKNFINYIDTILKNDFALEQLKASGWKDEPLDLIKPEDADYNSALDDYELSYLGNEIKGLEERRKTYKNKNVHFVRGKKDSVKNIDLLRKLVEGIPITEKDAYRQIPIIQHSDIPPLRWCHAEMALIPTQRSLNVLFFEN